MQTHPTIYDVARQAKVSPATVSRVFSQETLVAERTRRRVIDVAEKLQFSTNRLAAGLRRGKTDAISLIIPFNTPELMDAAQRAANARQYTLMVHSTFQPDVAAECRALKMAMEHQVAGVIWQPTGRAEDYASILPRLKRSRTAVLLLERGKEILPTADLVYHDTEDAFRTGLEHLESAGYRTMHYLSKDDDYLLRRHRLEQFERASKGRAGVMLYTDDRETEPVLSKLNFDNGPVALFVDSDWTALSILQSAEAMGLRIPQDLGVIVLGDFLIGGHFRLGEMTRPMLTAMQRQQQETAKVCVDWLLDRIDNGRDAGNRRDRAIPPQLVVRDSTRLGATPQTSAFHFTLPPKGSE